MTCDEAAVLLHALVDGELDASHAREIETHAAGCARCTAELSSARELRRALQGHKLRYAAPASLRGSIERAVPLTAAGTTRRSLRRRALPSWSCAATVTTASSARPSPRTCARCRPTT
jgi:anti-sigma factor RsiW